MLNAKCKVVAPDGEGVWRSKIHKDFVDGDLLSSAPTWGCYYSGKRK
jgi:hypothetical protein